MASRLYKHREKRGELLITVALRYTLRRFEIQTSRRFKGALLHSCDSNSLWRFEQAFDDSRLFESQKHPLESAKACLNLESTKCVPRGHRIYFVDHTISTRPPTFNTSSSFLASLAGPTQKNESGQTRIGDLIIVNGSGQRYVIITLMIMT